MGFQTLSGWLMYHKKTQEAYHILRPLDTCIMANKDLNRLKVVLVEQHKTAKWLAEQMGKDPATISKWCTNKAQPSLETIKKIAEILQVKMSDLVSNEQPL